MNVTEHLLDGVLSALAALAVAAAVTDLAAARRTVQRRGADRRARLQSDLDARAQTHQQARRSGRLGAAEQTAAVFADLEDEEQAEHEALDAAAASFDRLARQARDARPGR